MDYQEFLKQKIKSGKYFGFDIDESEINPILVAFTTRYCNGLSFF